MTFDELFTFAPDGPDRWIAPGVPATDEERIFGGVLIGQAIVAAGSHAPRLHALHAFFISVGSKQQPFQIAVERTRDGRSFATRHIEVRQGDQLLLTGHSSHHDGNDGPEHRPPMPDTAPPDGLEDQRDTRARRAEELGQPRRNFLFDRMLDIRPVPVPVDRPVTAETPRAFWFRPREAIRGGRTIHQAAIGFASDFGLVYTGLQTHAAEAGRVQAASLDHSIWFHREPPAAGWMLYVLHAPTAGEGRGFARGEIFTQAGVLIASVAQEFLMRYRKG